MTITRYEYRVPGQYTRIFKREMIDNGEVIYLASCPELPELMTHGSSIDEAIEMFEDVITILREDAIEHPQLSIPSPPQYKPTMPGTYGRMNTCTLLLEIDCDPPAPPRTCWQKFRDWWWRLRWRFWWRLV
jgi:predicted RNase H-like HicB family nuclease